MIKLCFTSSSPSFFYDYKIKLSFYLSQLSMVDFPAIETTFHYCTQCTKALEICINVSFLFFKTINMKKSCKK